MLKRADLDSVIGLTNAEMMKDNHRNHAQFISALLVNYNGEVLVNTVFWVFRAYRAYGFQLSYWPAQLDRWVGLLQKQLSPASFDAIYPICRSMLIHQAGLPRGRRTYQVCYERHLLLPRYSSVTM